VPDITSARPDADVISSLSAFIREFGGGGREPVSIVVQSRCATCHGSTFWMQCSEEEGVANRTCTDCKRAVYIGDSDEHWEAADVGDATCPCGKKVFHIGVGYCLTDAGEVAWMIVGASCVSCSNEGVYADWCIDYEPSKHLLDMA
jgi:hypothetical protein